MTAPYTSPAVNNLRGLTFTPTSALSRFRRVRLGTDGKLAYAGASDTDCIGVLQKDAVASGVFNLQPTAVEPTNNGQYCGLVMIGVDAITAPAAVYAAASGKVSASGTVLVGTAISSTTADGDEVVVLPSAAAILGSVARTGLTADTQPYAIGLDRMRTHATLALLGSAAGTPAGDFGLTPGTHGTNSPLVIGEAASGNAKSDSMRFQFVVPAEYVSAGNITLRIHARVTGLLQVSETIDAQVYAADGAGGISADLCATAAQTLTATMADYDFTITGAALVPGSVLDILIVGAIDDTGGTANKLVQIGGVSLRMSVKG